MYRSSSSDLNKMEPPHIDNELVRLIHCASTHQLYKINNLENTSKKAIEADRKYVCLVNAGD